MVAIINVNRSWCNPWDSCGIQWTALLFRIPSVISLLAIERRKLSLIYRLHLSLIISMVRRVSLDFAGHIHRHYLFHFTLLLHYRYTSTYACYKLFKKFVSHIFFRPFFFTRPVRISFFLDFLTGFSYKTKWHLFGIGRKNTLFNVFIFFP